MSISKRIEELITPIKSDELSSDDTLALGLLIHTIDARLGRNWILDVLRTSDSILNASVDTIRPIDEIQVGIERADRNRST